MDLPDHIVQVLRERKEHVRENVKAVLESIRKACPPTYDSDLALKLNKIIGENASFRSKIRRLQSLTSEARKPIESIVPCREGCSACCHMPVEITETEAELIGDAIAQTPVRLSPGHHKLVRTQHSRPDTPCPFLRYGACSIYEYRPIVCRNHTVIDVDSLLCGFESMALQIANDSRAVNTPMLSDPIIPAYCRLVESRRQTIGDIRHFFPLGKQREI